MDDIVTIQVGDEEFDIQVPSGSSDEDVKQFLIEQGYVGSTKTQSAIEGAKTGLTRLGTGTAQLFAPMAAANVAAAAGKMPTDVLPHLESSINQYQKDREVAGSPYEVSHPAIYGLSSLGAETAATMPMSALRLPTKGAGMLSQLFRAAPESAMASAMSYTPEGESKGLQALIGMGAGSALDTSIGALLRGGKASTGMSRPEVASRGVLSEQRRMSDEAGDMSESLERVKQDRVDAFDDEYTDISARHYSNTDDIDLTNYNRKIDELITIELEKSKPVQSRLSYLEDARSLANKDFNAIHDYRTQLRRDAYDVGTPARPDLPGSAKDQMKALEKALTADLHIAEPRLVDVDARYRDQVVAPYRNKGPVKSALGRDGDTKLAMREIFGGPTKRTPKRVKQMYDALDEGGRDQVRAEAVKIALSKAGKGETFSGSDLRGQLMNDDAFGPVTEIFFTGKNLETLNKILDMADSSVTGGNPSNWIRSIAGIYGTGGVLGNVPGKSGWLNRFANSAGDVPVIGRAGALYSADDERRNKINQGVLNTAGALTEAMQ